MVRASASSSTGFTNLRTIALSSRATKLRTNPRPSATSSWVTASLVTPTPTNFGSVATWVTKLIVMPLRRSPLRLPSTYKPYGIVHSTRRRSLSYSSGSIGSTLIVGGEALAEGVLGHDARLHELQQVVGSAGLGPDP